MNGRVIYAVPELPVPVGGVRVLHRHVELLVEAGVDAYVWTPTPGFSYEWFDSPAPKLQGAELELSADDLLVVPETAVLPGVDPAPGARKVVFNQAHFLCYLNFSAGQDYPGWDPVPGMWVVSEESAEVMGHAEPALPLSRIPNPIDLDLFRPAAARVRRIAWMPRKRPMEADLLERLLRADPRSEGVELVSIQGLPEAEVARILGESTVFLALGFLEGFGLPIAEALACGCLVAGYSGGGGRELFEAPGTWEVPEQRAWLLADRALELTAGIPGEQEVRGSAREWVASRYSAKATLAALLAAVDAASGLAGAAATAVHPMSVDADMTGAMLTKFMGAFGLPTA